MLRKLFHSGESTGHSAAKKPEADSNGNRNTEFAEMVVRLERFEGDTCSQSNARTSDKKV